MTLRPVEHLACGCFVDSLSDLHPCVQHQLVNAGATPVAEGATESAQDRSSVTAPIAKGAGTGEVPRSDKTLLRDWRWQDEALQRIYQAALDALGLEDMAGGPLVPNDVADLVDRALGAAPPDGRIAPPTGLDSVARDFIAYYSRGEGCSNCGGLPHSDSCFVGRFIAAQVVAPSEGRIPRPTLSDQREALAALAHEQWSGWMRYLFSRCRWEQCALLIPEEWEARWKRQIETPYADLSEAEKDSDRKEADRVLALLLAPALSQTGEDNTKGKAA